MARSVTHALSVDTRILREMKNVRSVLTAIQPRQEGGRMLINVVRVAVVFLTFSIRYVHMFSAFCFWVTIDTMLDFDTRVDIKAHATCEQGFTDTMCTF